jgi:acid phosphatase
MAAFSFARTFVMPTAAAFEALESRCLLSVSYLPTPDHVVIVVEENRSYDSIIGNDSAPYLNSLAQQGALMTDSHGVARPSQPNYLALFSGSTQGVTDDDGPLSFGNSPNLGAYLNAVGRSFAGYSEDLPAAGSTVLTSDKYARKHNPWSDFSNVPAGENLPFSDFPSNFSKLPTVSFVIPNEDHNSHDGSISAADNWLEDHLGDYATWAKTHNSLLIVTYDEAKLNDASQHIPTIIYGANVVSGHYNNTITHCNVLRTVEDMYALPALNDAAGADPILNIWSAPTTPADTIAPTADLSNAPRLRQLKLKYYTFSVKYADNVAVVPGTMDGSDIVVTGPDGYSRAARLVKVSRYRSGPVRVATYQVKAPNGSRWLRSQNGFYQVMMQGNEVSDTNGNFVVAVEIGQFRVFIPRSASPAAVVVAPLAPIFSTTSLHRNEVLD